MPKDGNGKFINDKKWIVDGIKVRLYMFFTDKNLEKKFKKFRRF